ncbi:MAG TPA: site-2 protease family protein [Dongiaceae bacterium]|nr:site-2 protease family protein [Dongiaceae bacterium]
MEKLPEFLVWYAVFLFTLTFHEGAHALVALRGGDDTAERGGQVTLNPLPHIRREPFGTIVFPILTFFMSGWMMGWASTPYNRYWADRHPRRVAAMSAAGPVANFVLAGIAFVVLRLLLGSGFFEAPHRVSFGHMVTPTAYSAGGFGTGLALLLSVALNLNVLLGLFNLIPLPPLDGAGIARGLFPGSFGALLDRLQGNPAVSMIGLLAAWRIFDFIFPTAFAVVLHLLHPGVYGS